MSSQTNTRTAALQQIGVRQWSCRASQCIQSQSDAASKSNEFLKSALKVAISLADQICRAEEIAASEDSASGNQLPKPSDDWGSRIIVRVNHSAKADFDEKESKKCSEKDLQQLAFNGTEAASARRELQTTANPLIPDQYLLREKHGGEEKLEPAEHINSKFSNGENELQPLPFDSAAATLKPGDAQTILRSILPDPTQAIGDCGGVEENQTTQQLSGKSLLDVLGADFLPSSSGDSCGKLIEKNERIYSLGVVFYELFSGGKIPPELESYKDFIAPGVNSNAPVNIGTALQILDDIGSDDEMFGHMCDESESEGIRHQNEKQEDSLINKDFIAPGINPDGPVDVGTASQILDGIGSDDDMFGHMCDGNDFGGTQHLNKKQRDSKIKSSSKSSGNFMHPISAEPLRMQRLPSALCDLIENMLDTASGDLSNDETYQEMKDVLSDLRLMLENPRKFLHDLDLDTLSVTGLNLNDFVFSRGSEFSSLLSAYQRSMSGESEFAIITGPSGVGKSALARTLDRIVQQSGGFFGTGKFDQLHQAKPFSALAEAFNQYFHTLTTEKGPAFVSNVSNALKLALGQDVYYLARLIPNMALVLNNEELAKELPQQECQDGQKRIEYLLCQMMHAISSSDGAPIFVLFLDDLQWADGPSLDVVKQLLLVSRSFNPAMRFFFLGCCRDDEIAQNHPLWTMICSVRLLGFKETMIPLCCMDKEALNTIVSELLHLSPRLTRTLTEVIYHKTKGNPLFFSRLMLSLNNEGLLRLSLSRRRWVWEVERIQERELPDDVAKFFTNTIKNLPTDVQKALSALSCFGVFAERFVIETLENKLGLQLIVPLESAKSDGLIDIVGDKFKFTHDLVQQESYKIEKSEEKCLVHFGYGLALGIVAVEQGNDGVLFTAVNQLNKGGPSAISTEKEGVEAADLNLRVGNKAMELSDFAAAYSFFDNGISFLRKKHWNDHYKLSLDLFEGAAKSSFVVGDLTSFNLVCDQILAKAQSFDDKLETLYLATNAAAYSSNPSKAIEKSRAILSQLGVEIPDSCSDSESKTFISQTRDTLSGISDGDLINYKQMSDRRHIMTLKFLGRLQRTAQVHQPSMMSLITLKMVKLTIHYGLSPIAPSAFAFLGGLLASIGNISEGYRFAKIANDLSDLNGSKQLAGEVMNSTAQIICLVEPLQIANELHMKGYSLSMAAGDMSNAILNSLAYCYGFFYSGANLVKTKHHSEKAWTLAKQQNHMTWLSMASQLNEMIMKLNGLSDLCTIPISEERALHENSRYLSFFKSFHELLIAFTFREMGEVENLARKFFELREPSRTRMYAHSVHSFLFGLVSFLLYRMKGGDFWHKQGHAALVELRVYSDSSAWNFEAKMKLLEAEEQYCDGNFEGAKSSYNGAIASAREHKFINEEALACELAGHFCLAIGERKKAGGYLFRAQECYHEWGAYAKANKVGDLIETEFGQPNAALPALDLVVPEEKKSSRKRESLNSPL